MMARTVLIADDHAWTRAALREALEREGFVVCAEAADAAGAVTAARRYRPSICLLDINMPGSGINATSQISSEVPGTAVVMLTVSRNDADLVEALRAGASSYLIKGHDERRIAAALRRALAGEATLPMSLIGGLRDEVRNRQRRLVPVSGGEEIRLTDREWDVLELIREGLTTAEMSERLFISQTTIRTHISRLLHKLKVPDREGARALLARESDGA
jgi:DNA-binding NarL/FixJ family response regulator